MQLLTRKPAPSPAHTLFSGYLDECYASLWGFFGQNPEQIPSQEEREMECLPLSWGLSLPEGFLFVPLHLR